MSCRDYCFTDLQEGVVIDVETTGLEPKEDRVITVAAVKLDFPEAAATRQVNGQYYHAKVNPECPIPEDATRIHGIKDEDVSGEECFVDIAQGLRDFIGDLPIVGHNIQFDKKFLNAELKRAGVKTLARNKSYCTLQRAKEHFGYTGQGWKKISLDQLAEIMKIEGRKSEIHEAMEDVKITMQAAVGWYIVDNGLDNPAEAVNETSTSKNKIIVATVLIALIFFLFYLI